MTFLFVNIIRTGTRKRNISSMNVQRNATVRSDSQPQNVSLVSLNLIPVDVSKYDVHAPPPPSLNYYVWHEPRNRARTTW
jgi:hypothetical protein